MPPVPLKFVVSFTSQDERHPVENILRKDSATLRWLSAPSHRTGHMEAIFQLERATKITHLDIGTFCVASVQVLVSQSSWPQTKDYENLSTTLNLMTAVDCRMGKNKIGMQMLKYDNFDPLCRDKAWDRIKIVLTQPFRKDLQFGLSVLRIFAADSNHVADSSTTVGTSSTSSVGVRPKTSQEIRKLFFGKEQKTTDDLKEVRGNLLKMTGSAENGSEQELSLSRTSKLVMAAASLTPKYKIQPGTATKNRSPVVKKQNKITFDEEVDTFLSKIDLDTLDLETVTVADLRHRLEKVKWRKLTKEEKVVFFKKTQDFMEKALEERERSKRLSQTKSRQPHIAGIMSSTKTGNNVSATRITAFSSQQNSLNRPTAEIRNRQSEVSPPKTPSQSQKRQPIQPATRASNVTPNRQPLEPATRASNVTTNRQPLEPATRASNVTTNRQPLESATRASNVTTNRQPLEPATRASNVTPNRQPLKPATRASNVTPNRQPLKPATGASNVTPNRQPLKPATPSSKVTEKMQHLEPATCAGKECNNKQTFKPVVLSPGLIQNRRSFEPVSGSPGVSETRKTVSEPVDISSPVQRSTLKATSKNRGAALRALSASWSPVKDDSDSDKSENITFKKKKGKAVKRKLKQFLNEFSQIGDNSQSQPPVFEPKAKRQKLNSSVLGQNGKGIPKTPKVTTIDNTRTNDVWLSRSHAPPAPAAPEAPAQADSVVTETVDKNNSLRGNTSDRECPVERIQDSPPCLVVCPICSNPFMATVIEEHAATCCSLQDTVDSDSGLLASPSCWQPPAGRNANPTISQPGGFYCEAPESRRACPICGVMFPSLEINEHVNLCLDN